MEQYYSVRGRGRRGRGEETEGEEVGGKVQWRHRDHRAQQRSYVHARNPERAYPARSTKNSGESPQHGKKKRTRGVTTGEKKTAGPSAGTSWEERPRRAETDGYGGPRRAYRHLSSKRKRLLITDLEQKEGKIIESASK